MYNLNQLRRDLKAIGYNFNTSRNSMGKFVKYKNLCSGDTLTGNVFSSETIKQWQPLFDFLKLIKDDLDQISNSEGEKIYGLRG